MTVKDPSVSYTDVLIIGAGPAGLMTATWLARMGVPTRIVDKRSSKVTTGQADGNNSRTVEIFESFGVADQVFRKSSPVMSMAAWSPGPDGTIRRVSRTDEAKQPGCHHYRQILGQAGIEAILINHIREHSDIVVERATLPESLDVDEALTDDISAYPITVKLRRLSEEEATPDHIQNGIKSGLYKSNITADDSDKLIESNKARGASTETVKAKFVIAGDGGHSWTRRHLGIEMEGSSKDWVWGVLDIIPKTNFPDIRTLNLIEGVDNSGTLLTIPRERGLVRMYTPLKEVTPDASGRADRSAITPDAILAAARRILSPYELDFDHCEWWTAYQIGQRVAKRFTHGDRIFLAGDAVHTHSPKEGLGMNTSMQDAYNLGWKIGLVAKGLADRSIVSTYEPERRPVAQELIRIDGLISSMYAKKREDKTAAESYSTAMKIKQQYMEVLPFMLGLRVQYEPSVLISPDARTELAKGVAIGQRLDSYNVIRHCDSNVVHFQAMLKSDGRFRVILFPGKISGSTQWSRMETFCAALTKPDSFLKRYATVLQLLTLHNDDHLKFGILDFPEILRPAHEVYGIDYNLIYSDNAASPAENVGKAYKGYGIDPAVGCVIVARPDQHVGYIGALEDIEGLESYFQAFLIPDA